VTQARIKEIKSMHTIFYVKFIVLQIGSLNSKIAFYLLVMTYKWLGNAVTAEIVYFIDSCFQILTHTMSVHFPIAIAQSAELVAAIKRLGNVLKALEVQADPESTDLTIKPKVSLKT
jgi:ATP-binding cassette subfamily C (CFTR/MRP) protein 4